MSTQYDYCVNANSEATLAATVPIAFCSLPCTHGLWQLSPACPIYLPTVLNAAYKGDEETNEMAQWVQILAAKFEGLRARVHSLEPTW